MRKIQLLSVAETASDRLYIVTEEKRRRSKFLKK
jgi:hypothetical protein